MADWSYWLAGAGLTVILELFSGTFYLLMIAIGLAAGAGAAAIGFGEAVQLLVAAVVGVIATVALRRSRYGRQQQRVQAERDPNVNLDIGQTVHVPAWQNGAARVMYRGALWDVELAPGGTATPGQYTIREVRGSRLIVAA
ncbi:Membrane protein implicated in regulation of membrane protease activity [Duganella sacchari]|uniref:Membrane protein implicated in regulation of membrane protease activity n=1 Tax=Duganella sacchari TaxID=551987 RepID=A0A1M7P8S9_9BURK|nr:MULTISPECIES: NfeD family protein [Duganella]MYM27923.1 NfeD family protein [Duganella sp. CY15W]SHN12630.1 Membrane protein implicated in regulation of membrane protease activity [Duganella sacchari]